MRSFFGFSQDAPVSENHENGSDMLENAYSNVHDDDFALPDASLQLIEKATSVVTVTSLTVTSQVSSVSNIIKNFDSDTQVRWKHINGFMQQLLKE